MRRADSGTAKDTRHDNDDIPEDESNATTLAEQLR